LKIKIEKHKKKPFPSRYVDLILLILIRLIDMHRILILQVHKNKSNDEMNKEQTIKGRKNKIKSNLE